MINDGDLWLDLYQRVLANGDFEPVTAVPPDDTKQLAQSAIGRLRLRAWAGVALF